MEERRLTAIMFSDITGYTAMMGKDEEKAIAMVKKARNFQEEFIRNFQGKLIDEAGDAVLACFNSASDAVHCALKIINASKADPELNLHIGIHLGEVIFSEDKVYGDGVNIAARIDTAAKAGEICISEDVWKTIKNKTDLKAEMIGKRNFKNVSEPVCLYRILIGDGSAKKSFFKYRGIFRTFPWLTKKRVYWLTVFILILLAVYILVFRNQGIFIARGPLEKSVAVLPFYNDSPDRNNDYICNGIMEQIIMDLQKIEGFRVPSRTSIEPFRDTRESTKEIASALGVANILEGSVQKSGDSIQVFVRLVKAKNDTKLWSASFTKDLNDIFEMQKDIATQVAYALKASLSSKEKDILTTKKPRVLSAYNYYLQARDDFISYKKDPEKEFLDKSIDLYKQAITIDSTYAEAYTGLALAYWDKHYWSTYMSANFLDSVKFLVNKALSYNNNLEEAYWLKSQYETENGDFNLAIVDNDHALQINPNYTLALWFKGWLDINYKKDFTEGLKIMQNVVQYEHGPQLPGMLRSLGIIYFQLGLYNISDHYNLDYARISGDSSRYYYYKVEESRYNGNYVTAVTYLQKLHQMDSTSIDYWLETGWINMMKKDYKKSLQAFETYDSLTSFRLNHMHRLAYLYWISGKKNKADDLFQEQILVCNANIKLNRWYATAFREAYYDLAGVYFFTGQRDQGFEYLREFADQKFIPPYMIDLMKVDPLFESVRNTTEFQSIISRFTDRAEREQSSVKQMLKDEGFMNDINS